MLAIAVKSGVKVAKLMAAEGKRTHRAMGTALKVEAFRLRKEGADDLKKGRLDLKPLSVLQVRSGKKARKRKVRSPLKSFGRFIFYKANMHGLKAEVGFIRHSGKGEKAELAQEHADGYNVAVTPRFREDAHSRGIHLKPDTHQIVVPARNIMGAVYIKHGQQSYLNIQNNFHRKLRGERI